MDIGWPTTLASHVAKHCNHVVNSPDENNYIGDVYKYSFFPLAIVQWNALPENVTTSPSLDSFKAAVGELQHPKP